MAADQNDFLGILKWVHVISPYLKKWVEERNVIIQEGHQSTGQKF